MKGIVYLLIILANLCEQYATAEHDEEHTSTDLYEIEGKVFPWDNTASTGWQLMTHVMANGGEHYGFLRYAFLYTFHQIACTFCIYIRLYLACYSLDSTSTVKYSRFFFFVEREREMLQNICRVGIDYSWYLLEMYSVVSGKTARLLYQTSHLARTSSK